ncbi:unnamed protein product [Angiostrongylus costaricensis]|uniref:ADF-H domain-containing protein n=1 Tax=Angiostrongylus costaricensis TaxID=334426 RepID=A0A0R3PMF7_ANGCS|nr:unnamed protein product [Angiostrongylus costaricensis]
MLGIMNSPADSVEFYAVNKKLYDETTCDDVVKTFTEVKDKHSISYTKDGRRIIDGKIVDGESETVSSLWESALRRSAVTTHLKVESEQTEEDDCQEVDEQEEAPKAEEAQAKRGSI